MPRFKPGISFGDFVIRDALRSRRKMPEERVSDFRRGWLVWLAAAIGLILIWVRLVAMQVINGSEFRVLSEENRVRRIKLPAPRGRILDRNGLTLAGNVKSKKAADGQEIEVWGREYPQGQVMAHVLGYIGEVAEDEVGILKEKGEKYEVGEAIGRAGIEARYEEVLRGIDGGRLAEVDSRGEVARLLGAKEPVAGNDLRLTIDAGLAKMAQESLAGKKGAVIVSVPFTGEILALVSSPSFDLNTLSTQYATLVSHADLPLFNRGIGGLYPPGSTFKMVTTLAATADGKVDVGFTFEDQGVIRVGTFSYFNWLFTKSGGTEGVVGFARAITRSTDTFFYKVGELAGPEAIAEWAKRLGYAEKTGVDIAGEVAGVIPDPGWKQATRGERWYLGDTYITAIGQGDILATPMQINLMTNILATGGKKCRPRLGGETWCGTVELPGDVLEVIKKGMVGACSNGGTAFVFFDWNEAAGNGIGSGTFSKIAEGVLPVVACKTGTAEYVTADGKAGTHALFTVYAPADEPEVSVTVVVEGGGEGSNVAAPIARKVLAKYFGIVDTYPYGAIREVLSE